MAEVVCVSVPDMLFNYVQTRDRQPVDIAEVLAQYAKTVGYVGKKKINKELSYHDLDKLVTAGVISVLLVDIQQEEAIGLIEGRILPGSDQTILRLRVLNWGLILNQFPNRAVRRQARQLLKASLLRFAATAWCRKLNQFDPPAVIKLSFYGGRKEIFYLNSVSSVPIKPIDR